MARELRLVPTPLKTRPQTPTACGRKAQSAFRGLAGLLEAFAPPLEGLLRAPAPRHRQPPAVLPPCPRRAPPLTPPPVCIGWRGS